MPIFAFSLEMDLDLKEHSPSFLSFPKNVNQSFYLLLETKIFEAEVKLNKELVLRSPNSTRKWVHFP